MALKKIDVTGALIAVAVTGIVAFGIINSVNGQDNHSLDSQSNQSHSLFSIFASDTGEMKKDDHVNGRPIVFPPIP